MTGSAQVSTFLVPDDHAGRRIDNFLLHHLKGVPKSLLYRIIRKGEIRVNKKRIKPDYRLQEGDEIRIPPITLEGPHAIAQPGKRLIEVLKQAVLYEDDTLMAINKPSGLAVHGGSGVNCGLIETLRQIYPKNTYLELVHRLDRDTSGCILMAKRPRALRELHLLWREGKVEKEYIALTLGHWPKGENFVSASLEKNTLSSGERKMKASEEGKAALTEFHVLERFSHCDLVRVKLHTGRMHQIRVHAQISGHPIAGDEKYGDRAFNRLMAQSFSLKRLFLHAKRLTFQSPCDQKTITLSAPLDCMLEETLLKLQKKR